MKISYNWLKQYINLDLPPEKISELLTNCGLEVEALEKVESVKGGLKGIVVGEVLEKIKHPNADKLSVTKVNIGNSIHQIVCGAPNVEAGQKVLVATIGTTLFPAFGEPFEIKKSKIRGETSDGMICAEDEIGFGTSHAGIMVLDTNAIPGTLAADYFSDKTGYPIIETDHIFEIGLTPNRGDAASHIGVARDLKAILSLEKATELKNPDVNNFKAGDNSLNISVEIKDDSCIRYSGISLSGIKIAESPGWLKNKLKAIGVKPINNVVDITNYVLMETGQPLHAFDADLIKGKKVIVKRLLAQSKFITLDNIERTLTGDELMICNAEDGMCMAGIFGGIHSGISEKTVNIFLESACFDPVTTRKAAKHHGLHTDASFRFERGTDVNMTLYALKRVALMIKEICGGKISSEIVDVYPKTEEEKKVQLKYEYCNRLVGFKIKTDEIKKILTELGFKIISESNEKIELIVPSYKHDITRQADVVEEILRIYGLNKIPLPAQIRSSINLFPKPDKTAVQRKISAFLVSNGFYEIFCNSLAAEHSANNLEDNKQAVKILNPLSADLNIMRTTLINSALETIAYNKNRQHADLRFFEFGTVYKKVKGKFEENSRLCLVVTGRREKENWNDKKLSYDIFYLKSTCNNLLLSSGLIRNTLKFRESTHPDFSVALEISSEKESLGYCGLIRKSLSKEFDINQDVYCIDANMDALLKLFSSKDFPATEAPKFPEVRRDLSMIIEKTTRYEELEKLAYESERNILREVNLFDVYEGDKLETGKKSVAMSFILRDDEKTLEEKQIENVMNRLMKNFEQKLGAVIRKG